MIHLQVIFWVLGITGGLWALSRLLLLVSILAADHGEEKKP